MEEAKHFAKSQGTSLSKLFKTLFEEDMARKRMLSRPILSEEELLQIPTEGMSGKTNDELRDEYMEYLYNKPNHVEEV